MGLELREKSLGIGAERFQEAKEAEEAEEAEEVKETRRGTPQVVAGNTMLHGLKPLQSVPINSWSFVEGIGVAAKIDGRACPSPKVTTSVTSDPSCVRASEWRVANGVPESGRNSMLHGRRAVSESVQGAVCPSVAVGPLRVNPSTALRCLRVNRRWIGLRIKSD